MRLLPFPSPLITLFRNKSSSRARIVLDISNLTARILCNVNASFLVWIGYLWHFCHGYMSCFEGLDHEYLTQDLSQYHDPNVCAILDSGRVQLSQLLTLRCAAAPYIISKHWNPCRSFDDVPTTVGLLACFLQKLTIYSPGG
jgi:hypothetical protein